MDAEVVSLNGSPGGDKYTQHTMLVYFEVHVLMPSVIML